LPSLFFNAIFEHGFRPDPTCARQFSGNPNQRDSGYYSNLIYMKTLEKFNTTELSEVEMNQTSGGLGILVLAFVIGLIIAYNVKN
jgi:hypothetical protein